VVLSLGGSIILKGEGDAQYLKELRSVLTSFKSDMNFIIVTGGGRTAREFIKTGRDLGCDEATLDWMGIEATRLNSWLVISSLWPECNPRPFTGIDEALNWSSVYPFTIGGGTHPGQTTDAVSALIAERWRADLFINMTSVDGAYTTDPLTDPDARRIDEMTSLELVELVSLTDRKAGSHSPMDPLASKIVHRAGLRTCILNGRDLRSFRDCLEGRQFNGTRIINDTKGA